jgi:hypothetical protein
VGLARPRRGEKRLIAAHASGGRTLRRFPSPPRPRPGSVLLLPPLPVPSRCLPGCPTPPLPLAPPPPRAHACSPRRSASAPPCHPLVGRRLGATGTEPLARFLPFPPGKEPPISPPRPRDSRLPEPFPRRSIAGSVPLCALRPPCGGRCLRPDPMLRTQPFSSSSCRAVSSFPHRRGYWTSEIRPERGWFLEALGWVDRLSPQFWMVSPIPPDSLWIFVIYVCRVAD